MTIQEDFIARKRQAKAYRTWLVLVTVAETSRAEKIAAS
jgi:hypothetical protein